MPRSKVEEFEVVSFVRAPIIAPLLGKHLEGGAALYYLAKDAPVFYEEGDIAAVWKVLRKMQNYGASPCQCRLVLQHSQTKNTKWAQNVIAAWMNNGGVVLFCDDFEEVMRQEEEFLAMYPLYDFTEER